MPEGQADGGTLKWGSLSAVCEVNNHNYPHTRFPLRVKCVPPPTFHSSWCSADENNSTPLCCLPLLRLFLPSTGRQSLGSGIIKNDTGIIKRKDTTPGATWVAPCCLGQCQCASAALQGRALTLQTQLSHFRSRMFHTALFSIWAIHSTESHTPHVACLSPESRRLWITFQHPSSTNPWKCQNLSLD